MLPLKIISLKNQKEFDQVSKSGKKIYGKHFIAVIVENQPIPKQPTIYLGLKVSRKMGNAVKRNKIKRWFREIVRKIAIDNPKHIGKSLILIPKKSISSTTYQELLQDFKLQLK